MIPVRRPDLEAATTTLLAKRQSTAARLSPTTTVGRRKIQNKWAYFLQHDSAAVGDVRARLDEMFADTCCYCERVIARDIEHFRPKSRYPDHMFRWDNLLRACKDCNFEKNDRDPLDAGGNRWFLDPTVDNPEDHFWWDLETGAPVYRDEVPGVPHRARDTLASCGADHETHREERRGKARFVAYVLVRAKEESPLRDDTANMLRTLFHDRGSRRAIIRQIVLDPAHAELIANAEAKLPDLGPAINRLRYRHPT